MAKKNMTTQEVLEKIFDYTLEDIMGERFGSYSKYIIQERAIPDARDGLKPVQRRILYSMHKEKNTYDKNYRKSAKTVGDVIGNYHPHGDSSIYDAMVRMSQPWKTRLPYIDMHGNNGSIDGDSPAAYRYTEARLSKISNEMLRDIDKNTVEFAPNFDDTAVEPTVLPARFPALLVYGSQGISAGYATNIPPHNLKEVCEATVYRIDHPECELDKLMKYIKGPDFPTKGIAQGIEGIKDAYKSGKGKIIIKSKYEFVNTKSSSSLVITEIPFEVNKAALVKKIDDIRIDKKIDGIVEVRDESTDDIRIVIDLKKNANQELIVAYLLKNTDLQISYSFNMVSIVNKRPKLLGLKAALDAFITHQRTVIKRRTEYDLAHAKARYHIVEGLIRCISILDEVIAVIRKSKNKKDAKENLKSEFSFSEEQAEAIVVLQLYRLTNTDIVALENELLDLEKIIAGLSSILEDEEVLKKVMKKSLMDVVKGYDTPRLTEIKEEITEIKIDQSAMIAKEDVIVVVTKDGYVKRTSNRSYLAAGDDINLKENDYIIGLYEMNTLDTLLVFTTGGNYLHIPVHQLPDLKWKDMPKHVSNIIPLIEQDAVVAALPVYDFEKDLNVVIATEDGMIKRTALKDFKLQRYSKPASCMKLKESDKVIGVVYDYKKDIMLATDSGYNLIFNKAEVGVIGVKASGVKGISVKDDKVVSLLNIDFDTSDYVIVVTDKGSCKRVRVNELAHSNRARRGNLLLRRVKTNPYYVIKVLASDVKNQIGLKNGDIDYVKVADIPILDAYSTGSVIVKHNLTDAFICSKLENKDSNLKDEVKEEEVVVKEAISLKEIDDRLMTIEDFLE